jgi:hypothetical protein
MARDQRLASNTRLNSVSPSGSGEEAAAKMDERLLLRVRAGGNDRSEEQHYTVPFDCLGQFAINRTDGIFKDGRTGMQRLPRRGAESLRSLQGGLAAEDVGKFGGALRQVVDGEVLRVENGWQRGCSLVDRDEHGRRHCTDMRCRQSKQPGWTVA